MPCSAHIRQSRPDSGLDIQVKVLKTLQSVPSSLGNGMRSGPRAAPPVSRLVTSEHPRITVQTRQRWGENDPGATTVSIDMAHTRQSRPDSGLGFQGKSLKHSQVFPLRSEEDPGTCLIENDLGQ